LPTGKPRPPLRRLYRHLCRELPHATPHEDGSSLVAHGHIARSVDEAETYPVVGSALAVIPIRQLFVFVMTKRRSRARRASVSEYCQYAWREQVARRKDSFANRPAPRILAEFVPPAYARSACIRTSREGRNTGLSSTDGAHVVSDPARTRSNGIILATGRPP
jgi:hypothetical protein